MDDEYSQILKLIKDVEASYAIKEVAFVNVLDITGGKSTREQKPDYQEVMQLVYSVEPVHAERRAVQRVMQQPQAAAGYTEAQANQPIAEEQQPPEQPATTAQTIIGIEKEILPTVQAVKLKAEKEIKEIVSRIPGVMSTMSFRRINVKDLVLPTLSISDQVSELERIIDGLRASMFDREHLAIVVQEVYGLRQEANRAARELKKSRIEPNPTNQMLLSMREQRLNDAIALLKTQGAG